jgi:hypothetical protein
MPIFHELHAFDAEKLQYGVKKASLTFPRLKFHREE